MEHGYLVRPSAKREQFGAAMNKRRSVLRTPADRMSALHSIAPA